MQALDYLSLPLDRAMSAEDVLNKFLNTDTIREIVSLKQHNIVRFKDGDSLIFSIFGKTTLITTDAPHPGIPLAIKVLVNVIYL